MQLVTKFCIDSMTVENYTCLRTMFGALLSEFVPPTYVFSPQDEVNAIKWDPTGTLLASCSDDFTAKVNFATHLVTSRNFISAVLLVFSNFQFLWKNFITIIVRKLWILRNLQIWSLKQDKCLHDLKDHSKVTTITDFVIGPSPSFYVGAYWTMTYCHNNIYTWTASNLIGQFTRKTICRIQALIIKLPYYKWFATLEVCIVKNIISSKFGDCCS